jgi:anhydro-N-acetylmuramic acid kinase
MRVLGLISGTSHDGVDSAVVDWSLDGGVLTGTLLHLGERPYEPELRARIVAALPPHRIDLGEVCALDTLIGQAFADVAAGVPADLICSHGQTLFHWVQDGRVLGTLQLGQPAWIAERTGLPVVSDVRVRDVAAGGQGAPLVSYLDLLLMAGMPGRTGALNLGGIANLTVREPALAYDTGPACALIDAAASPPSRSYGGGGHRRRRAPGGAAGRAVLPQGTAQIHRQGAFHARLRAGGSAAGGPGRHADRAHGRDGGGGDPQAPSRHGDRLRRRGA